MENSDVVFYYKGIAREEGVPFALNTIVAFEPLDAMIFEDKQTAISLCDELNHDESILSQKGYSEFEVIIMTTQYLV